MFISPFQRPGEKLIVRLDASSLKNANCAKHFELSNLRGYNTDAGAAADFGTAIHKATAAVRTGSTVADATSIALDYLIDSKAPPDTLRTTELLLEILAEYLPHRLPGADNFKSAKRDGRPGIELPFEIPFRAFDEVDFTLTGVFDELGGFVPEYSRFLDIKSTALMPRKMSDKWKTSSQMLFYSYVAKSSGYATHYPSPVIDMIFIRLKRGSRFVRIQDNVIIPQHVDEYIEQVWDKSEEIYNWLKRERFLHNRTCCETVYGDCKFRDVCDSGVSLREHMMKTMYKVREYDPSTFGQD